MSEKTFPILYHKGKKGQMYSWLVWAKDGEVYTDYGLVDGKRQHSVKKSKAKNVGRSNETTPVEQALNEAESLWKFKLDRKYRETVKEAQEDVLRIPMLAHKFDGSKKKKLIYPVDVQPKFDGVRCTAERTASGGILLNSRSGKEYVVPHIADQLSRLLTIDTVLDGELYIHGVPLQTITSFVKKTKPGTENISYYIYDVPVWSGRTGDWLSRNSVLGLLEAVKHNCKDVDNLFIVKSDEAESEEDVYRLMSQYVADGYEGAIVRARHGEYLWGYRSSELLKVKDFQDNEFVITGYDSGVGKFEDAIIWVCETAEGKPFRVVPRGSMKYRRELFAEADQHVGRMLKVKYFALTNDGIPQFPVGLAFRLEEDIS